MKINKHSIDYSVLCFLLALCFGIIVVIIINNVSYISVVFSSAFSAAVTGYLFWYLLIERKGRYTYSGALFTGLITVILSHYTGFYLLMILEYAIYRITGVTFHSLGLPPSGPSEAVLTVLLIGSFSLLFFGLFSIPTGIISSLLYMKYTRSVVSGSCIINNSNNKPVSENNC